MKKVFLSIFIAVTMVLVMVQCAGNTSYNEAKCANLVEKIKANEELNDKDYNEMIDQVVGIAKTLKAKEDEYKDNPEKKAEFEKSEEFGKLIGYYIGFAFYLDSKENDLSPSNIEKLKDAEKEIKSLDLE